MNLQSFRQLVDQTSIGIVGCDRDLVKLYEYANLKSNGGYQIKAVSDALYDRIRNAFSSGHQEVWKVCRDLKRDLIREHVILEIPLDPYFEVVSHLQDAIRGYSNETSSISGDWKDAVLAAKDHIEISTWRTTNHERIYSREFAEARAAKYLKKLGYEIKFEPGILFLEEAAEKSVVQAIETLVSQLGGLNVAKEIFSVLTKNYDSDQGRYHVIPPISMSGGGAPQIPWGYLLQLAVKHIDGKKPYLDLRANWQKLIDLITAYAALFDVQPYYPAIWRHQDATTLIQYLREQALYDSMFKFPQLRASDVLKICRGAVSFFDTKFKIPDGWALEDAFEVLSYLVDSRRDVRGPVAILEAEVQRALPHIEKKIIKSLLVNVFSHSTEGPNQGFSRPMDFPTKDDRTKGANFYLKPLIQRPGNRYLIIDRSACGWGYVEALMTALRPYCDDFDDKVGKAIERFLRSEFSAHGISVAYGDYSSSGGRGECDLAIESSQTLIFLELKKKALTRRARAGVDVDLLLDLAGSMLAAQAQAGWHRHRISKEKFLDISNENGQYHLALNECDIERVAVGMLDFGSFQDRTTLHKFLEAMLPAKFNVYDQRYKKSFDEINGSLQEIRDQYNHEYQGASEVNQPFFNCWFISIPQLLIMLDRVSGADNFRAELWSYRHVVTGASDLYYEIWNMRRMKASVNLPNTDKSVIFIPKK